MKRLLAALVSACLCVSAALAQAPYPSQPIHVIVPNPPGGVTNLMARLIGQEITTKYGQPVIVENKPGGGGSIGSLYVARAAPDGYTLLFHGPTITVEQNLHNKPTFDVRKDVVPIGMVLQGVLGLHVSNNVPVNTVQEFLRYAKANPGKLNFGTAGEGSFSHLMSESMFAEAGLKGVHIPFQGGGPLLIAVIAGQVDVMLGDVSQTRQQVAAGKLKLLGVASAEKTLLAPGVPTLSESGIPGFSAPFTYGFFAPPGTKPELVARINAIISEIVNRPDMQKKFLDLGYEPKTSSPEEFKRFIDAETTKMGKLIDSLGLQKTD
jgi:tripartite-type tricarboxylate transporter receptor subunit TctC